MFAVHYPDLLSTANQVAVEAANVVWGLPLLQFVNELSARYAMDRHLAFMFEGDRLDDPIFAYMNDTDVLENTAEGFERDHGVDDPEVVWHEFTGEALKTFLQTDTPWVCERKDWHPDPDIFDRFFASHPHPIHIQDQYREMM